MIRNKSSQRLAVTYGFLTTIIRKDGHSSFACHNVNNDKFCVVYKI